MAVPAVSAGSAYIPAQFTFRLVDPDATVRAQRANPQSLRCIDLAPFITVAF